MLTHVAIGKLGSANLFGVATKSEKLWFKIWAVTSVPIIQNY